MKLFQKIVKIMKSLVDLENFFRTFKLKKKSCRYLLMTPDISPKFKKFYLTVVVKKD